MVSECYAAPGINHNHQRCIGINGPSAYFPLRDPVADAIDLHIRGGSPSINVPVEVLGELIRQALTLDEVISG